MFGFFIFIILAITGLVMMVRDVNEMFYYRETTGTVTGFREVRDTEPPHNIDAYVPMVKFTAGMKEYSGEPGRPPLWSKPDRNRAVIILYHRDYPDRFRIKPRSRVAGWFFFFLGIAGSAWLCPDWLKQAFQQALSGR